MIYQLTKLGSPLLLFQARNWQNHLSCKSRVIREISLFLPPIFPLCPTQGFFPTPGNALGERFVMGELCVLIL